MTSSPSSADRADATLDERLAAVKVAGRRRRARRLRLRAAVAGVVAVTIVGGVATWPDDGATVRTDVAGDPTSTTRRTEVLGTVIERDTEATTSTAVTTIPPSAPTTSIPGAAVPVPPPAAPPSTAAPTVTVPPAPCQSGPECGPFRWEPAPPPNRPLVLEHDPVGPAVVGSPVTITVRWSDGDARLSFFDDDSDGALLGESCSSSPRYGPWALPTAVGGSGTRTITFTPASPGPATIEVHAASGTCDGYDPYHSAAGLVITFEVAPGGPPQP